MVLDKRKVINSTNCYTHTTYNSSQVKNHKTFPKNINRTETLEAFSILKHFYDHLNGNTDNNKFNSSMSFDT